MEFVNRISILSLVAFGCTANAGSKKPFDASDLEDSAKTDRITNSVELRETLEEETVEAEYLADKYVGYTFETEDNAVIDIALSDRDGVSDGVFMLYGPQRDNGSWPRRLVTRDEEWIGTEYLSEFRLRDAGTYLIVLSEYERLTGKFALSLAGTGIVRRTVPTTTCNGGTLKPGPAIFLDGSNNLECIEKSAPICVTNDSSRCPLLSPRPPDWCANGTVVQGAPRYIDIGNGLSCEVPSLHCVTKDIHACPFLSPRPLDWCAGGEVVNNGSTFASSSDGMECAIPDVHCVSSDACLPANRRPG